MEIDSVDIELVSFVSNSVTAIAFRPRKSITVLKNLLLGVADRNKACVVNAILRSTVCQSLPDVNAWRLHWPRHLEPSIYAVFSIIFRLL